MPQLSTLPLAPPQLPPHPSYPDSSHFHSHSHAHSPFPSHATSPRRLLYPWLRLRSAGPSSRFSPAPALTTLPSPASRPRLHMLKRPRAKQVVADPSKLVIPGMKGSLFAWSHWRYYSMAHVCAHHLARWYLNAHGDMLSSPPSTFTHGIPPISTVSTVPTVPTIPTFPDFSTASTSYVPTLAPAVSTTTSPEILPTTPATPPPIGPGPAGTSGDIGVAHVARGPGARRKPSISERVVDAVAPETFTAFSGTSPE